MKAQKLIVSAQELNPDFDGVYEITNEYSFPVWEFPNGAILVPNDMGHDYWFDSKSNIEPNGRDVVKEVTDTGDYAEFSLEEIEEAIKGSISEFGEDSIPSIVNELIQTPR